MARTPSDRPPDRRRSRSPDMRRFKVGAGALVYASPLYRMLLTGRAPRALALVPLDPWPGRVDRGEALLAGRYTFAGETREGHTPPWLDVGAGASWLSELHGFDWLRDLRALGGDAARRQARLLVTDWLENFSRWHPVAWAPDVCATRIAAWMGAHDFFLASADDALRARVFDSLQRQVRHLGRMVPGKLKGVDLLLGLKGLIYGGVCLPGLHRTAERARWLLVRELGRQIMPDGGQVERNPSRQLATLRHLIDIRAVMRQARLEVPEAVQHAIDRVTPAVRFFRHGDGGLALFNGACEEDAALIDTVLGHADARGRPLRSAPHVGFERLTAGRVCVVMDVGAPPPPGFDRLAHAGALSFEMSVGRERLIVNCGAHPVQTGPWRGALASTAAHSTVGVDDTNSAAVRDAGGIARRPAPLEALRRESGGAVLVEAAHDGYRPTMGLVHHRRLYLAATGDDLRGEDSLEMVSRGGGGRSSGGGSGRGRDFALRFHLHPGVQASLHLGGDGVLLRLPSGAGWRLRVSRGAVTLEESVYCGRETGPQATTQIVIRDRVDEGGALVKWALRRDGAAP